MHIISATVYTSIVHTMKGLLATFLNTHSIWLLQLHNYPSCANSKNLVLVKHFGGGK